MSEQGQILTLLTSDSPGPYFLGVGEYVGEDVGELVGDTVGLLVGEIVLLAVRIVSKYRRKT